MSTVLSRHSINVRIGELLLQAGMLSKAQLTEAVRHAGGKRLQIGQILVMHGYVSAKDLQTALDAQSMIRDKSLEIELAVKYLKIAYKTGARFVDVLGDQDKIEFRRTPTGKLGELLLESGVISKEQFSDAMQRSLTTGLPLGRMLVLNDVINETLLSEALEIQVRLRDEMLLREEAMEALRAAAGVTDAPPVVQRTATGGLRHRGIRLGELLVLAGVLSETDIMNALEWGLINDKPIGQVLVVKKLVTRDLIDAALHFQSEIENNTLTAAQASECLARIHTSGCSVAQALTDMDSSIGARQAALMGYDKFLTLCGVVGDEDIEAAFSASSKSAQIIARVLHVTGYIDEPKMQATLRCYQMYSRGWLSQDDALASLRYCLTHRPDGEVSFDEVLKELGWKLKEPLLLGEEIPSTTADGSPEAESPILPEPEADESASAKGRRFADTIQPEDPHAMQLARLAADVKDGDPQPVRVSLVDSFIQLAKSYAEQGNYVEAQKIYERVLVQRLKEVGSNNPSVALDIINLTGVLCAQGKFNQAEPFMRRLINIYDQDEKVESFKVVDALSLLSRIYMRQEKYVECEPVLKRAVELRRKLSGTSHPDTIETLADYARLMRKTNRNEEAEELYKEVRFLRMLNQPK